MTTATLREFRHNFGTVEKAAKRGPVKITRRGRVIGTYTAAKSSDTKGWPNKPDFLNRPGIKTDGPVDVLDFLGR